ncbi:MFS transporter [Microbacterium sp. SSW1-47]|uniref:MFS transporter n=1 Tax=Microbacterium sufflavum TaxID=2851649 RepID=UPI001FFCAEE3|nr:MFS transporter [Microbacterium sufflavum]MCK2025048.1 MFS transporter [Microbacterium sufflavum]
MHPRAPRPPLPPAFTRLSWSSVLTQFAEQIALVAVPLAAVLLLGADAASTALLQVAQTLPFLLLAIPFGLLVDRSSPRRLLLLSEALRASTLVAVIVLLALDALRFESLLALGFAGAVGTMGISVAVPAAVPRTVSRDRLVDANRWLELGRSAAFIGGPAVAGAIVSLGGADTAFVVASVACLAALVVLARTDIPARVAAPRMTPWRDIGEGLRFAFSHALLRPMIVTSFVFNVGWFLLQSVFVVYALDRLGMTPATVGAAMAVYGGGMVIGALLAPVLSRRFALGALTMLGPLGGFAAALLMAATLWVPVPVPVPVPAPAFAFAAYLLFGLGPVLWTIGTTSLRQAVTPVSMIGRVSSVLVVATYGARPVGAALGAVVAAGVGVEACIVLCAGVFAAQLGYVLLSALRRVREIPADPADAAVEATPPDESAGGRTAPSARGSASE